MIRNDLQLKKCICIVFVYKEFKICAKYLPVPVTVTVESIDICTISSGLSHEKFYFIFLV